MTESPPHLAHKQRRGLERMRHALIFSLHGLRTAWRETAFRQEVMASVVLLPLAFWLGRQWSEVVLLIAALVLVLVVEIINSAIETVVDRIGPQWHELSKRAKDLGSAAVLLSLLLCAGIWGYALYARVST